MNSVILTFKDDLNAFLKNNALWIALVIVGLIAISVLLIVLLGKRAKK